MDLLELQAKAARLGALYDEERAAFGDLCDVVADLIDAIDAAPTAERVDTLVEIAIVDLRPRDLSRHPWATLLQAAEERRAELASSRAA